MSGFINRCPRLFLLGVLAALSGCSSYETAKGDVLRIEKRTLPTKSGGFRLVPAGRGRVRLHQVRLCPVQERKIYREVVIRQDSAAVAGAKGVGCTVEVIGQISQLIGGQRVDRITNCKAVSQTDRRPTGRKITEPWKTVRSEPCGASTPVTTGGEVEVTYKKSLETRRYPLGSDGAFQIPREDLIKIRLYLTILKDVEIDVRYRSATWRQKIDLD